METKNDPISDPGQIHKTYEVEHRFRVGANWFFWIAGLSLVNSAVILSGSDWSFVIGLGTTQVIDVIATEVAQQPDAPETTVKLVAFGLDLVVAGMVVLFGILARTRFVTAFVIGMFLYGIDGLIFVLAEDWLSIGFHAFALFGLWGGLKALRQLKQIQSPASEVVLTIPSDQLPDVAD